MEFRGLWGLMFFAVSVIVVMFIWKMSLYAIGHGDLAIKF